MAKEKGMKTIYWEIIKRWREMQFSWCTWCSFALFLLIFFTFLAYIEEKELLAEKKVVTEVKKEFPISIKIFASIFMRIFMSHGRRISLLKLFIDCRNIFSHVGKVSTRKSQLLVSERNSSKCCWCRHAFEVELWEGKNFMHFFSILFLQQKVRKMFLNQATKCCNM